MKFKNRFLIFASFVIIFSALITVCAFAADSSGYTFDSDKKTYTNIKWTFTEESKTVVFEIDASATDKKASTVLYAVDPESGISGSWNNPIKGGWGQSTGVKKVIIKEGITEINGYFFSSNKTLTTLELPTSLKKISGEACFQGCRALSSVYVTGNSPVAGEFDFSCVESFGGGSYVFDHCVLMETLKLSDALTGNIGTEFIKAIPSLKELVIPAGVKNVKDKALAGTSGLKLLTVLGSETVIASDLVFNGNTTYPAIKAKAGSKAAEFALANGYTFIDIDSGVETKGTKPAPVETPESSGNTDSGSTEPTTPPSTGLDAFDPNKCTAYGYIKGEYYDTYWVYYSETKTLKFISNITSGWNETGRIGAGDNPDGWSKYKAEIEHVEVGPYIKKVSYQAFKDHTALKDIKLNDSVSEINSGSFSGCTSLTTIWREGTERVEGRADLTKLKTIPNAFEGTKINEFLLADNVTIAETFTSSAVTLLTANITDTLISYAKEKGYDLKSTVNSSEVHNYYDLSKRNSSSSASTQGEATFNKDECTAYGYIKGDYYDTYWAYYRETKTLKFFASSTAKGWIETGRIGAGEDALNWSDYKDEIEYVEVGSGIIKVSYIAFKDHTALKEVKLGKGVTNIGEDAFSGCTSLTTIYRDGGERIEGRADFSKIESVPRLISGTQIKEVLLSSKAKVNGTFGFKLQDVISPVITEELIQYVKENGYNLINSKNPEERYDYYVEKPDDMIMCGERCGFGFDESTGTLTVYGAGEMADVVNYYGGGSKNAPWFSIKQQIKHIVIGEYITAIGKYNFTQCQNLETVQIPDVEGFIIGNAAFEKCTNLKSVYRQGTEPIEGTLDLSKVNEINAWTFAYDYLIANVIVSENTNEIGKSVFEDNVNLQSIYGVPGSFAETYASENGKAFCDISVSTPEPIKCEIPETTEDQIRETESVSETQDTDVVAETTDEMFVFDDETDESDMNDSDNGGSGIIFIIIIAVVAVIVVAVIFIIIKGKKKAA